MSGSVASTERMAWLIRGLAEDGVVMLAAAAETLGVSEMTIRRDLVELEEQGVARRVRGGARAIGPQSFTERRQGATRAKGRIAAKLKELLPASGAVAFDASSTVMRLANLVTDVRGLTILTNGPDTFGALQDLPGVEPLLSGGRLDGRTGSLVGPLACRSAGQLAVQVLFASAAAVSVESGALETTLDEAEVKRVMAARADRVVLAVDASKLSHRGLAVGLTWEEIDVLVTDLAPTDKRLAPFAGLAEIR